MADSHENTNEADEAAVIARKAFTITMVGVVLFAAAAYLSQTVM